tara:strand:- start:225 stop:1010 length:786 start_codon:yes stop_codon:yes gene_type:complete
MNSETMYASVFESLGFQKMNEEEIKNLVKEFNEEWTKGWESSDDEEYDSDDEVCELCRNMKRNFLRGATDRQMCYGCCPFSSSEEEESSWEEEEEEDCEECNKILKETYTEMDDKTFDENWKYLKKPRFCHTCGHNHSGWDIPKDETVKGLMKAGKYEEAESLALKLYNKEMKINNDEEDSDEENIRWCDNGEDCLYEGYCYDEVMEEHRGKPWICIGCKTGVGLQEREQLEKRLDILMTEFEKENPDLKVDVKILTKNAK